MLNHKPLSHILLLTLILLNVFLVTQVIKPQKPTPNKSAEFTKANPALSTDQFGPLKIRETSPIKTGYITMAPYVNVPENQKFYIYVMQRDFGICHYSHCGMYGVLVECAGGWLSNIWDQDADLIGLDHKKVIKGEESIVIVVSKENKILGIYPNKTTKDLPYILQNHMDLSDTLTPCFSMHM